MAHSPDAGCALDLAAFFDRWIVDAGGVRGASSATWGVGALLRLLQVGNLQAYSFLFGLGIVGLIYFTVFPLMLLFILFAPIVAALVILLGAPARRTAVWTSAFTLVVTLLLFSFVRSGSRLSIRHLIFDQRNVGAAFLPSASTV